MMHPADHVEPPACDECDGFINDHAPWCRTLLDTPEVPIDYDER